MATTLAPKYALEQAKRFVKKIPDADIQLVIANEINARLWNAGNFVWTLNSTSVSLTPSTPSVLQQNYDLSVNLTDCARFVRGMIMTPKSGVAQVRTDQLYEVNPVSYIPNNSTTAIQGVPSQFYYIPGTPDKIRFDVSVLFPNNSTFYGIYKKSITPFTPQTLNDTTNFFIPDEWYHVFMEGVLWRYFLYSNDDRAGSIKTNVQGNAEYGGQLAVFQEALDQMRMKQPEIYLDMRRAGERKE